MSILLKAIFLTDFTKLADEYGTQTREGRCFIHPFAE